MLPGFNPSLPLNSWRDALPDSIPHCRNNSWLFLTVGTIPGGSSLREQFLSHLLQIHLILLRVRPLPLGIHLFIQSPGRGRDVQRLGEVHAVHHVHVVGSLDVGLEVALLGEREFTVVTLMRFFTRVFLEVNVQGILLVKGFVTDLTHKWTLACKRMKSEIQSQFLPFLSNNIYGEPDKKVDSS